MYENFDNCLSPFEFSNTASLQMQDFAPVQGWRLPCEGCAAKEIGRDPDMKILLLLLAASTAFANDWGSIQRIPAGRKIEVIERDGTRLQGPFVSSTEEVLVIEEKSGTRSLSRAAIRQVRVFDAGRRVRRGLLLMLIGAAAGAAAGAAICPSCSNEGNGTKFVAPGLAIGAGIGALGFLSSPYKTIYKVSRLTKLTAPVTRFPVSPTG